MILTLALALSVTRPAVSTTENANTRMKYESFNLPAPLNMSDDDMKVKDLSTFVRHHGDRQLRWYEYVQMRERDPETKDMKQKLFELMKQAIYAAQDRIKHLDKVLDKYKADAVFRIGYVFTKLDQLLEDLRRIYTQAASERDIRNRFHVVYYSHAAKKNVDITYIVEYLIAFHTRIYDSVDRLSLNPEENKHLDLDFS